MATKIKNFLFQQFEVFNHPEFGALRTFAFEGAMLFVAKDAATALGYKNPSDAIAKKVSPANKKVAMLRENNSDMQNAYLNKNGSTAGFRGSRMVKTVLITEAGLYELVMGSKLPDADVFKAWVTGTVLPSIRAYGGYILAQEEVSDERRTRIQDEMGYMTDVKPREIFCGNDMVIGPDGLLCRRSDVLGFRGSVR